VALAATILLIAVGVATAAGLDPLFFLASFALAVGSISGPLIGWSRALWGAVAVSIFVASWVVMVDPYVGVRLDIATIAVLVVVVVALLTVVWIRDPRVARVRPRIAILDAVFAMLPAAVSAGAFVLASLRRGIPISWAMRGDAQFNTVLSRIVGNSNGETATNVQVPSLAQGLMALVHLPGRSRVSNDQLLIHDITRQAELWLLMILVASVLGGAIAARVLEKVAPPIRWLGILGASALPVTWHMTGYAMSSGFYNVSLSFLVIELGYFFWLTSRRFPLIGAAIALCLSTEMLGAWTPMTVITLAWAAWGTVVGLRRGPRRGLVVWAIGAVQFLAFAVAFIVPSFLSSGSLLTHDGTILPLARNLFIAMVAAVIVVAVAIGASRSRVASQPALADVGNESHAAIGIGLLAAGSAAGVALLVFQNRSLPEPWIYYPIKFAWVSMEMMILVLWIGGCLLVARAGFRRVVSVLALGSTAVFLVSVLKLNPPSDQGITSYFPLVSVAKNVSPLDATLPELSAVANQKVFFSRYSSFDQDLFMNQWQFQLTATDEFTPIRGYAYRVVQSLADVCDAAKTWGGGVKVITSSPRWANEMNGACGSELTAVVRRPNF
jgi:hypothetical protein